MPQGSESFDGKNPTFPSKRETDDSSLTEDSSLDDTFLRKKKRLLGAEDEGCEMGKKRNRSHTFSEKWETGAAEA